MLYIEADNLVDGLYNIKDGEIFKYKKHGGTVRPYRIRKAEPNLVIVPETIERGCETYIGEDIVVAQQDDFMDMKCKAMMWDAYGEKPKQEWIPCSERLPEENGFYLVAADHDHDRELRSTDIYSFIDGEWYAIHDDIVAWMPLPKPWEGADNESLFQRKR